MASEITQASLNLTSDEKRAYGQLFQQADNERLGVVTGDVAVKFFERTKLDPATLAQIWQIADSENRGLLTPAGFSVALRLIAHCQAGREANAELAKQPGPLPRFDPLGGASQAQPSPTQSPIVQQNSGPIRVPALTPDKVAEFTSLFEKAGARNGYLGGDPAKQMFERARLPNETLGRIWMLSDTEQRGALNLTEFIIAMHLITSTKNGSLRALPQTLPAGLFEAASRRGPPAPASRAMQPQFTGQAARPQSPLSRSPRYPTPPVSAQTTGNDWLVTPQDKAKFDQIFAGIDTGRTGTITGDQAVSFFSTSGLDEDTLATIWDLADINSEGQLNRDEFAVAMYLIRQQRGKREDRGNLPSALPPQLIPPSMRQRSLPPSQPTAPAFDNAANAPQQPKSAADDLFGLDALSNDTAAQQSTSQSADASAPSQGQPQAPVQTQPTGFQGFKPFQPSSSFGQGIAQQNTGTLQSPQQQSRSLSPQPQTQAQQNSAPQDLLGDNDAEVSSKLGGDSAELGNMSNQLGSLRSQMSEVQTKRSTTEADLVSTTNQKRELETRLKQFRTQYEQEIREVKAVEERLQASKAETQKLQQEIAMVEGAHADLQGQHKSVATALDADQKENSSLKERIQRMNAEIAQLKPQLEKMRADARQQKGMVAINKKQLSTNEAEKEKVDRDMNDLEQEKVRLQQDPAASQEASRQASPAVSPPTSSASNTNPFFRRAGVTSPDRAMSPSVFSSNYGQPQGQNAFDSFFGPSDTSSKTSQPPPTTSFRSATPHQPSDTTPSPAPVGSPSGTPQVSEPPAPPESRQMDSNALPLHTTRSESFGSSVAANSPTSRAGGSDHDTPMQTLDAPAESSNSEKGLGSPPSASPSPAPANQDSSLTPTGTRDVRSTEEEPNASPPPTETVPGAFPGDSSAATTPTTEASDRGYESFTSAASGAQPQSAPSNAFSPFAPAGPTQSSSSEFPPIKEIDQDDDSDSDDEPGKRGFDDDFESSSAATGHAPPTMDDGPSTTASQTRGEGLSPADTLPVPNADAAEVGSSDASQLPTPRTEQSPPAYDRSAQMNGDHRESNQFPQEYGGLLPSREITHSPPAETPQSPPADLSRAVSQSTAVPASQPPDSAFMNNNKPTPADDFDSAFDDLSEAKQDEGDAFGSSTRSDYEFNPNFDSPAPSHATISATPRHQPTSSFDSAFGSNTQQFYGSASQSQPTQQTSSGGNDWDDLFSGLDSSKAAPNGNQDPFDLSSGTVSSSQNQVRDGPAPTYGGSFGPSTTKSEQYHPPQEDHFSQSSTFSPFSNNTNPQPPQDLSLQEEYAPPPGPPPSAKAQSSLSPTGSRPAPPPRAISQGTENDDPILKQLTSMGYGRDASVNALEKYDYNLDMAADHLARNS